MKSLDVVIADLADATEHLGAMMVSKETWNNALAYLREYNSLYHKDEHYPGVTVHFRSIIPADEWNEHTGSILMMKIKADMQIKIDELLQNYEQAYGLEPVTFEDAKPFLSCDPYRKYLQSDEQLQVWGFKIYKKRIR